MLHKTGRSFICFIHRRYSFKGMLKTDSYQHRFFPADDIRYVVGGPALDARGIFGERLPIPAIFAP
jgi:hypothetical protein